MSNQVIVLVEDDGNPSHSEVTITDDSKQAERHVEVLLEAGYERERIRVFVGTEMQMQVTHRPVVALTGDGVSTDEDPSEDLIEGDEAGAAEGKDAAEPFVQNGVRFSSQFKTD